MDSKELAQKITEFVGKDNISSVSHCATRLRLIVKDKNKVNVSKIEKLEKVNGIFFDAGQYQIILGEKITKYIFNEISNMGYTII
ncbi:PTS transporter subunit EIIB [uncultured Brachyspira sp.]|uniref:PTS transporter subunit EIIB n=1 Tax=uncultured Brachyspira sp. TaxID=221953 RepID=UPI002599464B|nr:PTS transporter subunit EIIB [uncultured Brachyspira sp.]